MATLDAQHVPLQELTADLVSAYVSNNPVPVAELPSLIASLYAALSGLADRGAEPAVGPQKPAVPIKKSVTPDFIISLEDGKKFKSLKRHLSTHYNMTPEDYRAKWNLPADYPMVAPAYAAQRSALAKSLGLGRKKVEPAQPAKSRGPRKNSKSA